jgi:hypothetical protein
MYNICLCDGITRALKSAQFICERTKGKYLPRHSNSPVPARAACVDDGGCFNVAACHARCFKFALLAKSIAAPLSICTPSRERRHTVHPTKTLSWRRSTSQAARPFIVSRLFKWELDVRLQAAEEMLQKEYPFGDKTNWMTFSSRLDLCSGA